MRYLPWRDYPLGTLAYASMGGHWEKNERGWKWCTGSTFPTPGADVCRVEVPAEHAGKVFWKEDHTANIFVIQGPELNDPRERIRAAIQLLNTVTEEEVDEISIDADFYSAKLYLERMLEE
jgi:hypothetical protein